MIRDSGQHLLTVVHYFFMSSECYVTPSHYKFFLVILHALNNLEININALEKCKVANRGACPCLVHLLHQKENSFTSYI